MFFTWTVPAAKLFTLIWKCLTNWFELADGVHWEIWCRLCHDVNSNECYAQCCLRMSSLALTVVQNRAKTSRPENKKGKLCSSCHGFSKRLCMLLHSVLVLCGKPWLCKQEVLPWLPAQCVLRSTGKGCTVQHYWLMFKPRHQFVWRVILSISPLFSARLKRFGTNSCREIFDVFPWLYFDHSPGFSFVLIEKMKCHWLMITVPTFPCIIFICLVSFLFIVSLIKKKTGSH